MFSIFVIYLDKGLHFMIKELNIKIQNQFGFKITSQIIRAEIWYADFQHLDLEITNQIS